MSEWQSGTDKYFNQVQILHQPYDFVRGKMLNEAH